MSFIYEQARPAGRLTFADGEADLGSIFDAAYESLQYVDNATARYEASERAYDERIRAIEAATGQRLENPLVAADGEFRRRFTDPDHFRPPRGGDLREWRSSQGLAKLVDEKSTAFTGRLAELAEKFPDAASIIAADRPVAEDARAIARDAEQRLATLAGSRDGAGKWAAMLAGGGLASLRDPITAGSMVAGGGAGGARTLFGRILTVATKEMLINAGSEALLQPSVQAWRREAGLDAGLDQAIRNIAFAGAFGGVLGAGGRDWRGRPFSSKAGAARRGGRCACPPADMRNAHGRRFPAMHRPRRICFHRSMRSAAGGARGSRRQGQKRPRGSCAAGKR